MDTPDLSLQQFLLQELNCTPLQKGVTSLGAMLRWQSNLPRSISPLERQDIKSVEFRPENYCHILLRLNEGTSFATAKETIKRYYREVGYDITYQDDSEDQLLLEATSATDTVCTSCRIDKEVLNVLVV